MNNRWRQIRKDFAKWNRRFQNSLGEQGCKYKCTSKTIRRKMKKFSLGEFFFDF